MKGNDVSISLLMIALALFSFTFSLNQQATNQLIKDQTIVELDFSETNEYSTQQFIDFLKRFSVEKQVSIARYHFVSENKLHIYAANLEYGSDVHLERGKWPKIDQFVSNYKVNSEQQVGVVSFPLSMWKVRYYPFDQVINVGIGDTYYLNTTDSRIKDSFVKEISYYADVHWKQEVVHPVMFVDMTLLQVAIFTVFVLFVYLFYQIYRERQQIYLSKLWGYSFRQSFFLVLSARFRPFLSITFILAAVIAVATFLFQQTFFWFTIVMTFLGVVCVSFIIIAAIVFIAVLFLYQSFFDNLALKGKPPYSNYQLASIMMKICIVISLVFVVYGSFSNMVRLKRSLDNASYWQQTKHIFRINISFGSSSGDLAVEKVRNDKIKHFYELLKKERNGFVLNAQLFYNNELRADKQPLFTYERNTTGEEQIYHSSGRRIVINENYLLYNPIQAADGVDIYEQLISDSSVLNILVPEQYKRYESLIRSSYKDYFHFQKVRIPNIFREAAGQPLIESTVDELDVHIIYTKSDQYYFSYNSMLGTFADHHYIKDPIAVIIHDSFDSSTITANATSSLFFEDRSEGEAYNSILSLLKQSEANGYVNFVKSVYDEQSKEIAYLWEKLVQQVISIVLMLLLSVLLLIIFTWSYYKNNMLELNLKYLFGYSYWNRHRYLLLVMLTVYTLCSVLVYFWIKEVNVLLIILGLAMVESVVLLLFTKSFNIKNTAKIIKGDRL